MRLIYRLVMAAASVIAAFIGSAAHAAITTYTDRSAWQAAVVTSTNVDFSTTDNGTPITDPATDASFSSLTLKGVTFNNVHSYLNESIYIVPGFEVHVDLAPNTTSFGLDLSSYQNLPGTYSFKLSSGETFAVPASGNLDFFGVTSSSSLQWIQISLNSSYLFIDNFSFAPVAAPTVTSVSIDIKPGASTNPVNLKSEGVIPVAILSSSTFSATSIDQSSLRFGRTGTEAAGASFSFNDVNGDGLLDLVVQFRTQTSGLACGADNAIITGKTTAGQSFKGSDVVQILGCPGKTGSVLMSPFR